MLILPPKKLNYPILKDIAIQNNKFFNSIGAIIFVSSAKNVFINNNSIINNKPTLKDPAYRGAIGISNASEVFIYNNTWSGVHNQKPGVLYDQASTQNIFVGKNHVK